MKKVKIAIALLSLVALVGFNLFVNLTDSTDPSTLLLDNVEALADGEIENYYNFKLALNPLTMKIHKNIIILLYQISPYSAHVLYRKICFAVVY